MQMVSLTRILCIFLTWRIRRSPVVVPGKETPNDKMRTDQDKTSSVLNQKEENLVLAGKSRVEKNDTPVINDSRKRITFHFYRPNKIINNVEARAQKSKEVSEKKDAIFLLVREHAFSLPNLFSLCLLH